MKKLIFKYLFFKLFIMKKILLTVTLFLFLHNYSLAEFYSDEEVEEIYYFRSQVDLKKENLTSENIEKIDDKDFENFILKIDNKLINSKNKVEINNLKYLKNCIYLLMDLKEVLKLEKEIELEENFKK